MSQRPELPPEGRAAGIAFGEALAADVGVAVSVTVKVVFERSHVVAAPHELLESALEAGLALLGREKLVNT